MVTSISTGATKNLVATTIFTCFALFFVGLRIVARFVFLKSGRRDEIAILISMTSSLCLMAATIYQAKNGLGWHIAELTGSETIKLFKGLWIAIFFYSISLNLTKFSIVLQYLRVFTTGPTRVWARIALGVVIAQGITSVLLSILTCIPIAAFWDITIKGRCLEKKFLWFFTASFNIFTDLLLLTVPMPALAKLFLPFKQKVLLMCLFGLGGFGCLVSVLRLQSLYVVSITNDVALNNVNASMWSNVEANVAIICASLQTIRPILSRCFPRLFTAGSKKRTYGSTPFDRRRSYSGHVELSSNGDASAAALTGVPRHLPKATTVTTIGKSSRYSMDGDDNSTKEILGGVVVTESIVRHVEEQRIRG